jgi:hypothetical protein
LFLPIIAYTFSSTKLEVRAKYFCWVSRGVGQSEGLEWVVRGGWGQGGDMTQALYAHMNNKKIQNFKIILIIK